MHAHLGLCQLRVHGRVLLSKVTISAVAGSTGKVVVALAILRVGRNRRPSRKEAAVPFHTAACLPCSLRGAARAGARTHAVALIPCQVRVVGRK